MSRENKNELEAPESLEVEKDKRKAQYQLIKLREKLQPQAEGYWASMVKDNEVNGNHSTALVVASDITGLLGRVRLNEALAITLAVAHDVVDAFIEALGDEPERPN